MSAFAIANRLDLEFVAHLDLDSQKTKLCLLCQRNPRHFAFHYIPRALKSNLFDMIKTSLMGSHNDCFEHIPEAKILLVEIPALAHSCSLVWRSLFNMSLCLFNPLKYNTGINSSTEILKVIPTSHFRTI